MGKDIADYEVVRLLRQHNKYLIITHIRPDGDTLGCAGALAQSLRDIGKTAYVLYNPEATARYACYVQEYWAPDDFTPEYTITVDIATADLIPENASQYKDNISLCIDHHGTNNKYALLTYCSPETASCGEIIYHIISTLLDATKTEINIKTANCLYVAVSTDTGCFCYRNTTKNTHEVAADLISYGAEHTKLNKKLFRTKSRERIAIEGLVYSAIEFFYDGKVAVSTITLDMMKASGATTDDIDDISNIPSSIEGVGIGITIREMSSPGDCKISVRSSPPFDASEICKKFGGGGHKAAAGATIAKTADEAKRELLAVVEELIVS